MTTKKIVYNRMHYKFVNQNHFGKFYSFLYEENNSFHYPNNNDYFLSVHHDNHKKNPQFSLICSDLLSCNIANEIIGEKIICFANSVHNTQIMLTKNKRSTVRKSQGYGA